MHYTYRDPLGGYKDRGYSMGRQRRRWSVGKTFSVGYRKGLSRDRPSLFLRPPVPWGHKGRTVDRLVLSSEGVEEKLSVSLRVFEHHRGVFGILYRCHHFAYERSPVSSRLSFTFPVFPSVSPLRPSVRLGYPSRVKGRQEDRLRDDPLRYGERYRDLDPSLRPEELVLFPTQRRYSCS